MLVCFSPSQSNIGAEAYGLLYLEINPSHAEIALDGQLLDVNIWLLSIPPGTHDLLIRKPGFKSHFQQLEINAGQSLHLNINLDPNDGAPIQGPNSSPNFDLE